MIKKTVVPSEMMSWEVTVVFSEIKAPLTLVPFLDPKSSSSIVPSGVTLIRAWFLETLKSWKTMSQELESFPMTYDFPFSIPISAPALGPEMTFNRSWAGCNK